MYRLADSLPVARRREWEVIMAIEDDLERQRKLERYLDLGHGSCLLRDHRISTIVQESLWYNDGLRYRLLAWVVMPNHIHVLVEVWQTPLSKILKDWKGYSGKVANKLLGREGCFWQEDYFDRYIRDEEHFRRVVRYIENNPVTAGLVRFASEWPWSSSAFSESRRYFRRDAHSSDGGASAVLICLELGDEDVPAPGEKGRSHSRPATPFEAASSWDTGVCL